MPFVDYFDGVLHCMLCHTPRVWPVRCSLAQFTVCDKCGMESFFFENGSTWHVKKSLPNFMELTKSFVNVHSNF